LEAFQNLAHACFLTNQQRKQFLRASLPMIAIPLNEGGASREAFAMA
jgi:hypothetical protein